MLLQHHSLHGQGCQGGGHLHQRRIGFPPQRIELLTRVSVLCQGTSYRPRSSARMTTMLGGGLERTHGGRQCRRTQGSSQDRRTESSSQDTSGREDIFTCTGQLGQVGRSYNHLSLVFPVSLSPGNRVYPVLRHLQGPGRGGRGGGRLDQAITFHDCNCLMALC